MKRILWSAIPALVALAACLALPVAVLQNLWRVTEMLDLADVTPIIAQLTDAVYIPGWLPAIICAAAVFAGMWLLHRHKVIGCILALCLIILGVLAALVFTHVNGVPMHVVVKILLEYVRLGAF